MSKLYSVTCHAVISEDAVKVSVGSKLKQLFGADEAAIDSFLAGKTFFRKTGLNRFTANEYKNIFSKIGLDAQVTQHLEKSVDPRSAETLTSRALPASHDIETRNLIETRQESMSQKTISGDTDASAFEETGETSGAVSSYKKFSGLLIRWGAMVLVGSFLADSYLRDVSLLEQTGFSIGMWPYLLGNVLMGAGTYCLAMIRDETRGLRWLGLLSFLGLAILLLLNSDSKKSNSQRIKKLRLVSLAAILITAYWVLNRYDIEEKMNVVIDQGAQLQEGRSIYPKKDLDDMDLLLDSELTELQAYLASGFELLGEDKLNLDDETRLANQLFQQASLLVMWARYQAVLQRIENGRTDIDLESVKRSVVSFLVDGITRVSSSRVRSLQKLWIGLQGPEYGIIMYRHLEEPGKVLRSYALQIDLWIYHSKQKYNNETLIKGINSHSPGFNSAPGFEIDGNFLVVTLAPGVAENDKPLTLVMACYIEKDDSWKGASVVIEQVGGDYPNMYMPKELRVFN